MKQETRLYSCLLGLTVILIAVWFVFNFFSGEHVTAGSGLGWDGVVYGGWAKENGLALFIHHQLDSYSSQRFLPSTLVHYMSKILHYDLTTPQTIINAFYLYYMGLLLISVCFFWRLAAHLQWSIETFFIGFCGLFVNAVIIKWTPWYVVLTDSTAFTLGLICVYFYYRNQLIALLIASFLGSFTWPSFLYFALPLILFKINPIDSRPEETSSGNMNEKRSEKLGILKLNTSIAFIISAALTITAVALEFHYNFKWPSTITAGSFYSINKQLIPISSLFLFAYLFFAFRYLINLKVIIKAIKTRSFSFRLLVAAGFYLLIKGLVLHFSNAQGSLTSLLFFEHTLLFSLLKPGFYLLSMFFYYGPTVALILTRWKDFTAVVNKRGLGLVIGVVLALIIGFNMESRFIINLWPLLVIVLCETMNLSQVSKVFCIGFYITSLVLIHFSAVWLEEISYKMYLGIFLVVVYLFFKKKPRLRE